MDVNTLRDRIVALSHNEDAPDTGLKAQALQWLNSAYRELMDELQPFLQNDLVGTQTVTTSSGGSATLTTATQRVLQVVDVSHNQTLNRTDLTEVRKLDPDLSSTGTPRRYWMQGSVLKVHPASEVTLDVLYLPIVDDLEEDGTEASILLPVAYHPTLVWGGLVWSTVFERGFSSQGDLTLFQRKWDEGKQRIKLSMLGRPDRILRTEAFSEV